MKIMLLLLSVFLIATAQAASVISVSADRRDCVYAAGEKARLRVTVSETNGVVRKNGRLTYRVDGFGGRIVVPETAVDLAEGNPFEVTVTRSTPGFLRLSAQVGNDSRVFGVAFSPERIEGSSAKPSDFESFWREARVRTEREVPLDVRKTHVPDRSTEKVDLFRLSFATCCGRRIYGFLAVPRDASPEKRYPLKVDIPGAGWGAYSNVPTFGEDEVLLWLSVFPFEPVLYEEKVKAGRELLYDRLNGETRRRWNVSGYFHGGIAGSREDCFYYPVIIGACRAIDWAVGQPFVDATRVRYKGSSQGGGMGLAVTALSGRITRAVIHVPALTGLLDFRLGRQSGWPGIVEAQPTAEAKAAAERNAPYFDGLHFASMIRCPIRFTVGFSDETCAPHAVCSAYNACPSSDKAIFRGIGMGHGGFPEIYRWLDDWLAESPPSGSVHVEDFGSLDDPTRVVREWKSGRRAETLAWFERSQFGKTPVGRTPDEEIGSNFVSFADSGLRINITCCLPPGADAAHPAPVFLFMDHRGGDQAPDYPQSEYAGIPTNAITSRGFAYVRWNGNDVCPNAHPGGGPHRWPLGIIAHLATGDRTSTNVVRKADSWGTIGAWAWGNSRVMDWIESRPELDARRVAVLGHSRGGKTALWTGAQDRRFALTISNGSGCGGAGLGRARDSQSEHFRQILSVFPNWFCPAMTEWIDRDADIPHDADDLIRLIAPRLVYVASGSEDSWACPKAERAAWESARDLYRAYGCEDNMGYHCHVGPHKLLPEDWQRFMDFAERHWMSDGKASPVDEVDPMIGAVTYPEETINNIHGFGKTFPGAATPFGMVQLSPDTVTGGDNSSGYSYTHGTIEGFSFFHMSGVGWYGEFGNFQVMPGTVATSRFSHDDELAEAGYYRVRLPDAGVVAELTSAKRAGMVRFTYEKGGTGSFKIDLARRIGELSRAKPHGRQTFRQTGSHAFEGEIVCDSRDGGWGRGEGGVDYTVRFRGVCSKPIDDHEESGGETNHVVRVFFPVMKGEQVVLHVSFDFFGEPEEPVGLDFDAMRASAREAWASELGRIRVRGGTARERRIFATALYHTMLDPREIGSGRGFVRRTVFSGWDVYRSEMPLLALIRPDVVSDTINSMMETVTSGKRRTLPRWDIFGCASGCMVGQPLVSVMACAYERGIRSFDAEKALELARLSLEVESNDRRLGYTTNSLSATLEYAYADWCCGRLAQMLGKNDVAARYFGYAQAYTNCWSEDVRWMRTRTSDGGWMEWKGRERHGQGCVESNPWQQGWFVPHDPEGLVRLMGGRARFTDELEKFFAAVPDDFHWNDAYNHPNEPCHALPYLWAHSDRPDEVGRWTRRICEKAYDDTSFGLCGNDDVGQMSAWYVLSAIGLHPLCPGDGKWYVTAPVFPEVRLSAGDRPLTIRSPRTDPDAWRVEGLELNGRRLDRRWVMTDELVGGGELRILLR